MVFGGQYHVSKKHILNQDIYTFEQRYTIIQRILPGYTQLQGTLIDTYYIVLYSCEVSSLI